MLFQENRFVIFIWLTHTQWQINLFHSLISQLLSRTVFASLSRFTDRLHSPPNSKLKSPLCTSIYLSLPFSLSLSVCLSFYPQVVAFHFWLLKRKTSFCLSYHCRHCGGYSIPESLAVFVIPWWLSRSGGFNGIHNDLKGRFFSDCLGDLSAEFARHVRDSIGNFLDIPI